MASAPSPGEYRLLVEHSPVMIWRADLHAKCDYFNDTWLAYTGRTLEQELGDGWSAGVHPDDLPRCLEHYLDHFHRREPFEMEYRLRRHDGVYRWIFDRGVPFSDDRGAFSGFIGSCVDVEERRQAELAREHHDRRELELAHAFERWVLACVGHDIRNPLGAIDTAATLLARRAGDEAFVRATAARISRSTERIENIVSALLDLSRERHGGGIPVVPTHADLDAICRQVIDELGRSERSLELTTPGPVTGRWDPDRVTQSISNLVANAITHGARDAAIEVRVRRDAGRAIVEVHNGGAIAADVLPTLFQPFGARLDRTRAHQGLGLGLFIARSIARAHGGELEVDSSPERGTTFRLVLPDRA